MIKKVKNILFKDHKKINYKVIHYLTLKNLKPIAKYKVKNLCHQRKNSIVLLLIPEITELMAFQLLFT